MIKADDLQKPEMTSAEVKPEGHLPTHHNTCPRGERCACYITGYMDAEYDNGFALDSLE